MKIWLDDQLDDPNAPDRHTLRKVGLQQKYRDFKRLIKQAIEGSKNIEARSFDNDLEEVD